MAKKVGNVTSIRLTDKEREMLRRFGGGNASAAIRQAIQMLADSRRDNDMKMAHQMTRQ